MDKSLEGYLKLFEKDRFAGTSGVKLVEASPGFARAEMQINKNHMNAVGVVQGGAIFTLADFAFAVASNTQGRMALAIEAGISFFKSAKSGTLTAVAREVSLQHKLGTYLIDITDDRNELIAQFKGTVYRKSVEIDFNKV